MDVNKTYCSNHFSMYIYVILCCTPKNNTMLYVYYISIIIVNKVINGLENAL